MLPEVLKRSRDTPYLATPSPRRCTNYVSQQNHHDKQGMAMRPMPSWPETLPFVGSATNKIYFPQQEFETRPLAKHANSLLCSLVSVSLKTRHKYLGPLFISLFSCHTLRTRPITLFKSLRSFFGFSVCPNRPFTMYLKAAGALRSLYTLCIVLSTSILPVLSAPASMENTSPWVARSLKSLFEPRAVSNKCGGTGVYLTNGGSGTQTFTVFGGGKTFAINSEPYTSVTLAHGKSAPVKLPPNFDGHVQRGNLLPATWVELNMVPGAADGDVSLEIGCDGAVTVQASAIAGGAQPPVFGFSKDIISHAPANAFFDPANPTGEILGGTLTESTRVLDATGTDKVVNANTLKYEQSVLSQSEAYLFGGVGTDQAVASDNCILITFY